MKARSEDLFGAAAAGLLTVAFSLLLLQHEPGFFWYDDYQISILPVFADIARSWSEGDWPLLSPYSWACGNLAGEFQYGTFSIFVNAAVIVIWKLPLGFAQQAAALSIAHIFVLAAGGYMLARGRDLAPPLAMMVGLVSALNGWMICWGASDWFGALAAFAWLPWAWWALERALRGEPGIGECCCRASSSTWWLPEGFLTPCSCSCWCRRGWACGRWSARADGTRRCDSRRVG
jgi:hypothetical protein